MSTSSAGRSEARILIVDPAPAIRQILGEFLSRFYHLSLAATGDEALERLQSQQVDLVLLDGVLTGISNARQIARRAQEVDADLPVVVLAAKDRITDLSASGKTRFLSKALLSDEAGRAHLLMAIERTLADLRQERAAGFHQRRSRRAVQSGKAFVVGESEAIRSVRAQAQQAAASDLNLLVTGETGVGKTLVAEWVHFESEQGSVRPFVVLEPSTVAPSLFESELFGHSRGAFTGATSAQPGALETAQGGTLFLDEIGDLDLHLQRKILRAVEDRIIRRVGDTREIHLDVRFIAATNRDLVVDIEGGRFRADLYQRLNELHIHVPPLRDRVEDVVPLLRHFLAELDEMSVEVTEGATRVLTAHRWPGNVRELRTVARRLRAAGVRDRVAEEDLRDVLPVRIDRGAETDTEAAPDDLIRVYSQRTYIEALKRNGYSIRQTARALGLPYHTLRSRLASLDLLATVKQRRQSAG